MLDKTVPFYSVIMVCDCPANISAPLPKGYAFTLFHPGMEQDWCRIQCSVEHLADMDAALKAFNSEFAPQPQLLCRRMLFVCDEANRAVATACLWKGRDLGRPMERVHWVATIPGSQGKGLAKALIGKLMDIYCTENCTNGIYLTTQTYSYKAIGLYRKFGFKPYLGPKPEHFRTQGGSYEDETRAAWQIIDGKLDRYPDRNGPARRDTDDKAGQPYPAGPGANEETDTGPPAAIHFEHETMFSKCSKCKVFEVTAPEQSGDTPHSHDYSQIWYVTRGSCEHFVEGQKYEMMVGDAFLLPPKVTHLTLLREGGSILCCEFYLEGLLPGATDSYFNKMREITQGISFTMLFQCELHSTQPKFTLSPRAQRRVEYLMHSMLDEYTRGEILYEDYLHLQILELLVTFARDYAQFPAHEASEKVYDKYRSMVETAIKYIDGHYDEPLTLNGICRISMVSKTYFCYLFKLLTHQTFVEYLMNLRINKAMELLRQTDRSVIDISQAVGFRDSTHFSRTFKRLKGVSPREYRSSNRRR